jgi:hypothetical protein
MAPFAKPVLVCGPTLVAGARSDTAHRNAPVIPFYTPTRMWEAFPPVISGKGVRTFLVASAIMIGSQGGGANPNDEKQF